MTYGVSVDLSGFALQAMQKLQGVFPLVSQAVHAVANEGSARWKSQVLKAPLWQSEKEAYIRGVSFRMQGAFAAVVETDYKNADPIETGRPAVGQKKYLQTSLKARVVQKGPHAGMKFLIVPIRSNFPGNVAHAPAMPSSVYEPARKLKPSRVTGSRMEPNVHGRLDASGMVTQVKRATYDWGGRLPAGIVPKLQVHHAADPYAGMVRMAGKNKKGATISSGYLVMRTMGAWSHGWIIPARPGLYIARGVSQELQPLAEAALQEAMRA